MHLKNGNAKAASAALWYILSNFVAKGLIYLLTPYYTRILTKEQYGIYSTWQSWQGILVAVASLCVYSSVINAYHEIKTKKEFDSYITSISVLALGASIFTSGILTIIRLVSPLLGEMDKIIYFSLIGTIVFSSTYEIYQAERRALEDYKISSILTLLQATMIIIVTLLLVSILHNRLHGVIFGNAFSVVLLNVVLLTIILLRSHDIKKIHIRYALAFSLPIIPHVIAGQILGQSDKIMITYFAGSEKTALYSVPYTVSMVVTMLTTSVNNAWLPWLYNKLEDRNNNSIQRAITYITPIFSVVTIFVILVAPELVEIIGGEVYKEGSILMPPIILGCFYHYLYTLYVNIEFYYKKTKWISTATFLAAIFNIIANFFCIRLFGYKSAAYTTALSNVIVLLFHYLVVKKMGKQNVYNNRMIACYCIFTTLICLLIQLLYELRYVRLIAVVMMVIILILIVTKGIPSNKLRNK